LFAPTVHAKIGFEQTVFLVVPLVARPRGPIGAAPPNFFCANQIRAQKNFFQTYTENRNISPLKCIFPPNLKTWLRACWYPWVKFSISPPPYSKNTKLMQILTGLPDRAYIKNQQLKESVLSVNGKHFYNS